MSTLIDQTAQELQNLEFFLNYELGLWNLTRYVEWVDIEAKGETRRFTIPGRKVRTLKLTDEQAADMLDYRGQGDYFMRVNTYLPGTAPDTTTWYPDYAPIDHWGMGAKAIIAMGCCLALHEAMENTVLCVLGYFNPDDTEECEAWYPRALESAVWPHDRSPKTGAPKVTLKFSLHDEPFDPQVCF